MLSKFKFEIRADHDGQPSSGPLVAADREVELIRGEFGCILRLAGAVEAEDAGKATTAALEELYGIALAAGLTKPTGVRIEVEKDLL